MFLTTICMIGEWLVGITMLLILQPPVLSIFRGHQMPPIAAVLLATSPFGIIRLHNRETLLTISITPPYSPIFKPFLFPNLNSGLDFLQTLFSSQPSCLPVRSRDGDQDALVPDIHSSQSMRHCDAHEGVLLVDLATYALQRLQGERGVGGV